MIIEQQTKPQMQKSNKGCAGDAVLGIGGCLGIIVLVVVFIALLFKLFFWIV